MDFGYVDVNTVCPNDAAVNTVRVTGENGTNHYQVVECSTCGTFYGVKVALSIIGTPTEYTLTP